MLKRTIFFSNPMALSLKDNQLVFNNKEVSDEKRTIPIEDIGFIVLEHQMISISLPLLNTLSKNNVAVIFCDNRQLPSAMLLNLDSNTTQAEIYKMQIEANEPLKKNLWKQTIESKIRNQASVLYKFGLDGDLLKPLYLNVKSGDTDNREAVAAKFYWEMLFGKGFLRDRYGVPPNNLLNYGYTILRAATARSLMGSGLFPAFGIFHRNRYNSFPLADDIMEPYRPFVDELVYRLYFSGETELTKEVKAKILSVLSVDTKFNKVTRPLDVGLSTTTASLAKCFSGKIKKISYPFLK